MLHACALGVEQFHIYVYSCIFIIQSNCKPLEAIQLKNLADVSVHLQHMFLHLVRYEFTSQYKPGWKMGLAEALSHLYPISGEEKEFNVAIHHIRIGFNRKNAFQVAIQCNPVLCELMHTTITDGWLDNNNKIPKPL